MIRAVRIAVVAKNHFRIRQKCALHNQQPASVLPCLFSVAATDRNERMGTCNSISTIRKMSSSIDTGSGTTVVRIGHVEREKHPAKKEDGRNLFRVPKGYLRDDLFTSDGTANTQFILEHLQWMMAKDNMGQDMMLVGPPDGGFRRQLALMYAELMNQEVEIVTLSSDVTESDLKQRRELVDGNIVFYDQAPVRAALHGRLLILDGIERAERNVLPTLNNLLENREMHLEDGRLLISPERHRDISTSEAKPSSILVPTHPDFRVIALGKPVPPYHGRTLDPPLRSRFQIRRVNNPTANDVIIKNASDGEKNKLNNGADTCDSKRKEKIAYLMDGINEASALSYAPSLFPTFAPASLSSINRLALGFPDEDLLTLIYRQYPFACPYNGEKIFGDMYAKVNKSFSLALTKLGLDPEKMDMASSLSGRYELMKSDVLCPDKLEISFQGENSAAVSLILPRGPEICGAEEEFANFVPTLEQRRLLVAMLQEHSCDRDILLIGCKGEGKSALAKWFSHLLGYDATLFSLYKDMSPRDLLMRRGSSKEGDTVWDYSPLVKAAIEGNVCILDGADKLSPNTLATIQSLFVDREICLPDGTRLLRPRDGFGNEEPSNSPTDGPVALPVHDSFRVIALASPPIESSNISWLNDEIAAMFSTLCVTQPNDSCLKNILLMKCTCDDGIVDKILTFNTLLTKEKASDCGVMRLSVRNMIRIGKLYASSSVANLRSNVLHVLMADLLPPTQRQILSMILDEAGITDLSTKSSSTSINVPAYFTSNNSRQQPSRPEMVPAPYFFDIPSQIECANNLLNEWACGERAFLLLGNQGVGKNKITDRLMQLTNVEREYIQLHRDSTVGQLTLSPSLQDGKVVWNDSPLVRAVERGCALVIDEADKAPVEVVRQLKCLVEDGDMLLADGRRIVTGRSGDGLIRIHPDFTLWVLANRPGHPFLGNDFFREVGDCFSCHTISNPDFDSEVLLLQSYAPNVPLGEIKKVASAFSELRKLSDDGDIAYPYSTREAVSVIKHLETYPEDGLSKAINNVLDMDSFDPSLYEELHRVFAKYDIRLNWGSSSMNVERLCIDILEQRKEEGISTTPPELRAPKVGKWDDNNDPHVGGNQWAGGTGGSDTAGLGGRGGPYRLDRGHKVHQVSDEAKAAVSDEAAAVAREIGQKALQDRLKEIGMSAHEYDMYEELVRPIRGYIANLRRTINSVEDKRVERTWIKGQNYGELDDAKLIDGVAGETYIYKRRGFQEQESGSGAPGQPTKRLRFVMDCSGSMYRFNSQDNRLTRSLEAAALIMEAFDDAEVTKARFDYSMVAHSGDSHCIPLIQFGNPPRNAKDRIKILQTMAAHSQFCWTGDNTLSAVKAAIKDVRQNDPHVNNADGNFGSPEHIVVAISDANLSRYGIHPRELRSILMNGNDKKVKAYCVFIASLGSQAEDLKKALPAGRGFVCMQTGDLPKAVRDILSRQMV